MIRKKQIRVNCCLKNVLNLMAIKLDAFGSIPNNTSLLFAPNPNTFFILYFSPHSFFFFSFWSPLSFSRSLSLSLHSLLFPQLNRAWKREGEREKKKISLLFISSSLLIEETKHNSSKTSNKYIKHNLYLSSLSLSTPFPSLSVSWASADLHSIRYAKAFLDFFFLLHLNSLENWTSGSFQC